MSINFICVAEYEKQGGGLRPCIDYRGLNTIAVKYVYPLPLVPSALEHYTQQGFSLNLTCIAPMISYIAGKVTNGKLCSV